MSSTEQQPSSPYVAFVESPHQLEVVDQRKLPLSEVRVRLRTVDDVKHAIENLVVRGSSLIAICGAFGMALAGETNDDLDAAKRALDSTSPTTTSLAHTTSRMLAFARKARDNRMKMFEEAKAVAFEEFRSCQKMSEYGSTLIPMHPREGRSNVNVIHHSSTGGLSTFGPGTALGSIMRRWKLSPNLFVWVNESRPRLEGAKLTAWELNRLRIPNNVVVDGAASSLLAAGRADCVFFSADSIAGNGDIVNKIGTYPLAVVARENGVPVYCVAPTSAIDLNLLNGASIKVEERSDSELLEFDGKRFVDESSKGYNPTYDVTPFRYITAIVTEEMICYPPFRETLAAAKAKALAKQQGIPVEGSAASAAVPANPEKIQQILEKAQPKRTSAERLFPPQNEPIEEIRRNVREDRRAAKPKTYLSDGSDSRFNSASEEQRATAAVAKQKPPIFGDQSASPQAIVGHYGNVRKSNIVLTDEAGAEKRDQATMTSPQAIVGHYGNVRKSNIVLTDEAVAAPKEKSNVRMLGNAKQQRAGGPMGVDDVVVAGTSGMGTQRDSNLSFSDMEAASVDDQSSLSAGISKLDLSGGGKEHSPPPQESPPTSKGHITPPSIPQESPPKSKGHVDPPKREDKGEKAAAKGHFSPPSPDRPPQPQSKGHVTPPRPQTSSNIFG